MKKLTLQEIKDTLVGCTILGTGGGGSLESGLEAVEKAWNAGHEFKLLSFDEINDDSYYANPYYCGSIVPKGDTSQKRGDEIATSVKALEEYMGVQFEGLVSIEYGGGNTGAVMAAAARTGKYIVDADAAGRAVPELQFSTYYVTENPITPFSVGTSFGDMAIVTNVENDARAEALSRYMAIGSGGLVGMTDHPIKGDKLRHAVIPNALTYAATVGRAQREAVERGSDPIQAILDTGKGKLLFRRVRMGHQGGLYRWHNSHCRRRRFCTPDFKNLVQEREHGNVDRRQSKSHLSGSHLRGGKSYRLPHHQSELRRGNGGCRSRLPLPRALDARTRIGDS